METISNQFSKAVDLLLKKKIIASKGDLATRLNYKPSTLSEILNGRSKVSAELARDFCKNYGINLYWLFYGEGSMFNESETTFLASANSADDDNVVSTNRDIKEMIQKEVKEALQRERNAQNNLAS